MHLYCSIFTLLLLSAVKLSINVNVSVPLAALYVQAITEPAPCLTDEVLCCSFFSLHISLMEADSCFTSQWIFLPRLSFFFFSFFLGNCNLMFRLSSLVCGEFCREWDLYYEAWFGDFVVDSTLTIGFQSHIDVLLRTIFFYHVLLKLHVFFLI